MSEFTQAFFKEISPETLEEMCQVAEVIAREEEDDDSPPLSPIVGYTFSNNSTVSSSSDTDPESRNVLNQLNSLIFQNADIDTRKTKVRRGKQRRKRRKIMSSEETEFAEKTSASHGTFDSVKEADTRVKEIESLNPTELMDFNKPPQTVTTSMGGFSTAGGKFISVSHDAVQQAQARLKEIVDLNSAELMNFKTKTRQNFNSPMGGFSTAGGKDISVPSDAVEQAKTKMKEIENLNSTELMGFNKVQQTVTNSMGGFSTARGKLISVSHDAVQQAQARLKEIVDLNSAELMNFKTKTRQNFNSPMGGFSTAGGKDISVPSDAVEQAQTKMKEIENLNSTELMGFNKVQQTVTNSMGGFSTARGKLISVSHDAVQQAQARLKEIVDLNSAELMDFNKVQQTVTNSMGGFSTARGKLISVSHDAVQQAQAGLKEIANLDSAELTTFKTKTKQTFNSSMGGFSTARGKDIAVSRDAVEQAQTRMKEIESLNSTELMHSNKPQQTVTTSMGGFSTAGGKDIVVSHDAVQQAQARLKEIENLNSVELLKFKPKTRQNFNSPMGGFSTAGGKDISVSRDAVEQAQTRMKEIESLNSTELMEFNQPQQTVTTSMGGFSTAQGKFISVSHNAVQQAQARLKEIENLNSAELMTFKTKTRQTFNPSVYGISTPGGQDISVSRESVQQAQKRMKETDELKSYEILNFKDKIIQNVNPLEGIISTVGGKDIYESRDAPSCDEGLNFSFTTDRGVAVSYDGLKKTDSLIIDKLSAQELKSNFNARQCSSTEFSNITIKHNSSTKAQATFSEKDILDQEVLESVSALLADEENSQLTMSENIDSSKEDDDQSPNEESGIIIPTKISSIVLDQKSVSVLNIYVARIYPIIYKHKSTDGKTVMLSQKQYGKIQRKHELENMAKQKKLLTEVEIEVKQQMLNKRKGRKSYSGPLKKEILDSMSPDDLLDIMEECNDVVSLERKLSFETLKELQIAKSQREDAIRDAIHNEFESRRKAIISEEPTALVKLLALDMSSNDESIMLPKNCALISIWRPSEDMMSSLREGLTFYVTNLTPVPFPKPIIQLNTTIKTRFEPNDNPTEIYRPVMRQCYNIKDVISPNFSPCFGEFDVTGLVVSVRPVVRNTGQVVYISDECKTFLGIRFWNNIVEEGLDDLLQEGNFVSISNLQWRISSPKSRIPQAFAHENCLFRTNPKDNSLCTSLDNLKKTIKDPKAFASTAEMTLFSILDGRNLTGNGSFNNSFGQDSTTGTTPMACSTPIANNQYLNANHTPNITPISNNTSKRLQLLESYGDPPPLPQLPTVSNPKVNNKFVAPFKK